MQDEEPAAATPQGTKTALVALCCLLAAVGCARLAGEDATEGLMPLPAIKQECSTCHVQEGTRPSTRLKKPLSAVCLDCHPGRKAPAEHAVDIVPSMAVKALPLTDGKMTCYTCHDPHAKRHRSLLRLKEADLCILCHPL